MEIRRVGVREGYDLWAETYETTRNPVVAADSRYTLPLLAAQTGELILDAGCGTGRNLRSLPQAVGIDFSSGMLRQTGTNRVAQADLLAPLPFRDATFDAVLCALIGEHLPALTCCREFHRVLRRTGRLVFSVYHPELAAAGKEANFQREGAEYRLGAVRYTTQDYLGAIEDAGFRKIRTHEFQGVTPELAGRNALLVIEAKT